MIKKFTYYSFALLAICLLVSASAYAQKKASPPMTASSEVNGKTVTINYSSPSKKGREIFGGLVPYDKVWRTGANEATTLEVSGDVKIAGKDLKKGKYGLFTIPGEKSWTIIINSTADQWGAYSYDKKSDVVRFDVTPSASDLTEMFTINVSETGAVTMMWDEVKVDFTIE